MNGQAGQRCHHFSNYQHEYISQLLPCTSDLAVALRKGEGSTFSEVNFPSLAEWEFIIEIKLNYREIKKITFLAQLNLCLEKVSTTELNLGRISE